MQKLRLYIRFNEEISFTKYYEITELKRVLKIMSKSFYYFKKKGLDYMTLDFVVILNFNEDMELLNDIKYACNSKENFDYFKYGYEKIREFNYLLDNLKKD